ncbi:hypothetical protein NQ318_007285 [Aromia moschata]|uniref:Uncharacterized protein n=1 Tax=Aromia moschata TaxID=1265417 RepID=A0AAV8Z217_9CUCU|nr:hypothetical protein NQ318_007285 [Aromia moschata]
MSGASVENLTAEVQDYDGSSNMCLELALEGERLCKAGDCRAGVAFFQAAIQAGTDDLRTLSAIYSQLGNAYFYLGDYGKAMQYHKHDLTLARYRFIFSSNYCFWADISPEHPLYFFDLTGGYNLKAP